MTEIDRLLEINNSLYNLIIKNCDDNNKVIFNKYNNLLNEKLKKRYKN